MKLPCGCCEGTGGITPVPVQNSPGRKYLMYRAGTHATFLETMISRLSSSAYPELAYLTTRDPTDPSIAMLDAWATVADILTFYQERIANEGYLRTATERRSVLELARLVGYTPRPGVASSVHLAYELEKGYRCVIPAGERAQSLPAEGELPQSFETSEPLPARAEWNAIRPRMTRPQFIASTNADTLDRIYLKGMALNLKPNDVILFVFGESPSEQFVPRTVLRVNVQAADNRTEVLFATKLSSPSKSQVGDLVIPLSLALNVQPRGSAYLSRNVKEIQGKGSDFAAQTLIRMTPRISDTFYRAMSRVNVTGSATGPTALTGIYVFRLRAALFGYNALPPKPPVANFSVRITGKSVQLTDTSTGSPVTWSWQFGDATSSGERNPTHVFAQGGEYDITLKVENFGGTSIATRTIYIAEPM